MSGSGYTPVFNSMLDGTLFGKWPHTGIWACLMSQIDRRGHIDVVPALLAAKIGVPVELFMSCMSDFMKPDPESRTKDFEGRRLELLEPSSRNWGWKVLNHESYRNKARKASYDSDRTSSGADAARKRAEREASRRVPTSPDASRQVPPSDSDSDSDTNKQDARAGEVRTSFDSLVAMPPALKPEPPRETEIRQQHVGPSSSSDSSAPTPRGSLPNSLGESETRERWLGIMAIFPEPPYANWVLAEHIARNAVAKGESTWDQIETGVGLFRDYVKATGIQVQEPSKWFGSFPRKWLSPWTIPDKRKSLIPQKSNDVAAWAEAKARAKAIGFREPQPHETAASYMTDVKNAENARPAVPVSERLGLSGIKRAAK